MSAIIDDEKVQIIYIYIFRTQSLYRNIFILVFYQNIFPMHGNYPNYHPINRAYNYIQQKAFDGLCSSGQRKTLYSQLRSKNV